MLNFGGAAEFRRRINEQRATVAAAAKASASSRCSDASARFMNFPGEFTIAAPREVVFNAVFASPAEKSAR